MWPPKSETHLFPPTWHHPQIYLFLTFFGKVYKKQLEEHRAKVNASIRKETSKKLKTTKQDGQVSPEKCEKGQPSAGRVSSREYQIAPQKYSVGNLEPVDMGAHLQLLGESLMLVGTALRRQVCRFGHL